MPIIRILPDIIVSQIAAGEVVERPYSVVKELVENSIDAASTKIRIETQSGGKRLITVTDNGFGMSRDDALLSIERHATSKIKEPSDLFSISTLGFRGEALPSIASVSLFEMITRRSEDMVGTKISVRGGVIKEVSDVGCPVGTTISVRRLFFNTPSRLKFMKTEETEHARIVEVVQREAISHPNIAFELLHNGKMVLRLPARDKYEERLSDVIPDAELYKVYRKSGDYEVKGYLCSPLHSRSTAQRFFTYVNSRPVRDRFITKIVIDSFGRYLSKGRYPQGVIFIEVPPEELDVNVHPTKREVRFKKQKEVALLIGEAVSSLLDSSPWFSGDKKSKEYFSLAVERQKRDGDFQKEEKKEEKSTVFFSEEKSSYDGNDKKQISSLESSLYVSSEKGFFSSLRIIGQVKELYIICEGKEGILLIDQHAAHERVNFEKIKVNYMKKEPVYIQELLIPEVIRLTPMEFRVYMEIREDLQKIGYRSEVFGDNTIRLRAVPALMGNVSPQDILLDILNEMRESGKGKTFLDKLDMVFATMACHSSVRANQKLTNEEISLLLSQLDLCESPFYCPHGRPVMTEFKYKYLENLFGRS